MTLEHIFLCKTLNIPFAVVVTKTDMLKDKQNVLDATLTQIVTLLKRPGMRRHPIKVKSTADIVRAAETFHSESIVPIFQVSNVTMEGIPDLHTFLNLLPKRTVRYNTDQVECHLDASWTVPGVGTVVVRRHGPPSNSPPPIERPRRPLGMLLCPSPPNRVLPFCRMLRHTIADGPSPRVCAHPPHPPLCTYRVATSPVA